MLIPWACSSGACIVRAVPSATLPWRLDVPDTKHRASMRVVFPDPPWPRTAMLRMRSVVYSLADAIPFSFDASRPADDGFRRGVGGPR
jgi:hypothetical protein